MNPGYFRSGEKRYFYPSGTHWSLSDEIKAAINVIERLNPGKWGIGISIPEIKINEVIYMTNCKYEISCVDHVR